MNGSELSWFDRLKIAITPKSHAEAIVDEIYGPEGRGLIPIPQTYTPELATEPASYVEAKQAVTGAISTAAAKVGGAVQSSFIKLGIIAFVAIAALVAINAFLRR